MIVDAFLFAGEAKMLELRLRTLAGVVDRFVPVACTMTHQGEVVDQAPVEAAFADAILAAGGAVTAPLFWTEPRMTKVDNNGREWTWPAGERGGAGSFWYQHIERQHRDGCVGAAYAAGAEDDDVLMISDVDEIPDPVNLMAGSFQDRAWWAAHPRWCLGMRMHSFALDLLHPQYPWWGTTVTLAGDSHPQRDRDARTTIGSAEQSIETIWAGGVHLSWMGSPEDRDRKLRTFSHAELVQNGLDLRACEREAKDSNGFPLARLSCEEMRERSWPEPMVNGSFSIPLDWWHDGSMAGNVCLS